MAVSDADFLVAFPEFAKTNPALRASRLAHAELMTSADAFGLKRDHAVMLRAADLLATSPLGRDAQLQADAQGGPTVYRRQLWSLMLSAGCASDSRIGTIDLTELGL